MEEVNGATYEKVQICTEILTEKQQQQQVEKEEEEEKNKNKNKIHTVRRLLSWIEKLKAANKHLAIEETVSVSAIAAIAWAIGSNCKDMVMVMVNGR